MNYELCISKPVKYSLGDRLYHLSDLYKTISHFELRQTHDSYHKSGLQTALHLIRTKMYKENRLHAFTQDFRSYISLNEIVNENYVFARIMALSTSNTVFCKLFRARVRSS